MSDSRISKRALDSLKTTGKEYFVWDSTLIGFGVRVRASGAKSYVIQYRAGNTRSAPSRRLTIGPVGEKLTPDMARAEAKAKLGVAATGGDPAAEKAKARKTVTVTHLAKEFLDLHVATKRKGSTVAFYRSVIETHIIPALGPRKATEVTRHDVAALHSTLQVRRTVMQNGRAQTRGGLYVANRVVAVMGAMFSWASKAGYLPEGMNPTAGIEMFPERGRERYLTIDEIYRIGSALREAETIGLEWSVDDNGPKAKHAPKLENRRTVLSPHVTAAIRLLMFTGCRLREILHLEWSQVDMQRGLLFLADSKTGAKTVVLAGPALSVLASLPRIGRFVIAGESAGEKNEKPRSDLKRPWSQVAKRAGVLGVRLHDLRHTFASFGAGSNIGLPVIGKLLGHSQSRTTEKYAHLAADPLRRASDIIAAQIAAALGDD